MRKDCFLQMRILLIQFSPLTYINALRQRANNGSTAANVNQSHGEFRLIIDERARIALEGHRRQDLICFNKYGGGSYNWA
jgi:hypothetical protein